MSERSSFFNSVNGDRKYKAEDMAAHFAKVLTNGVMPAGIQLRATESSGMTIVVTAGSAWINGYAYHNDSDFTLAIDPADGVLNRIDRVVVRWSRLNRAINLVVLKGTPASSAAAPPIVRNADHYDLSIATVIAGKGITAITTAMITDTRMDSNVCGFVSSLIKPDTSGWFVQFEAVFNNLLADNQADWDAWFTSAEAAFNAAMVANQAAWDIWFATVQGALDGDTAGNLFTLINGKADKTHTHVPADLTAAVPVTKGGTGATTPEGARTNIGAAVAYNGTTTLLAAGWQGMTAPYTYVVPVAGMLATDNGRTEIVRTTDEPANKVLEDAAAAANIRVFSSVGALNFHARGTKPTVNIPVSYWGCR